MKNRNKNKKTNYTHQEVAVRYFPEVLPESASRQLTRWIMRDDDLYAELLKAGYTRRQRMYSPLQLTILFDHLGDPEDQNIK